MPDEGAPSADTPSSSGMILALLVFVSLLLVGLSPTSLDEELDRVVTLLRRDPDDSKRLDSALRWASRGPGSTTLAEALTRSGRANEDGLDLLLAARVQQRSGAAEVVPALLEEALHLSPEDPRIRWALVRAWLDADWPQAARKVAGESGEIPPDLALRLAAASGDDGRVEGLIEGAAAELETDQVIEILVREGSFEFARRLAREVGELDLAVALSMAAGEYADALAALAPTTSLSPDDALTLARFSGDRGILDLCSPTPSASLRQELEEQWQRSLGNAESAQGSPRSEPEDRPVAPVSTVSPGIAEAIASGISVTAEELSLLARPAPPSLAVACAWLELGEEERARRELALANLAGVSDGEERWRGVLERRRPDWFSTPLSPGTVASALATAIDPQPDLIARGRRAFAAAQPGSDTEARLLFQIGRLSGDGTLIERAARIAPGMWVTAAVGEGFSHFPLDPDHPVSAADELPLGPEPATPPPGTRVGQRLRGALRVPGLFPLDDALRLQRIDGEVRQPGKNWGLRNDGAGMPRVEPVGPYFLQQKAVNGERLEGIAPLEGCLSLTENRWLIAGSGLAFLERKGDATAVALVIRWPRKIDLWDLPPALRAALPAGARPFSVTSDMTPFVGALRHQRAIWDFIEGASSTLRTPPQPQFLPELVGAWTDVVESRDGLLKVRFNQRLVGTFSASPSPFPESGTLKPFDGDSNYQQQGLIWRRQSPENSGFEAPPTEIGETLELAQTIEGQRSFRPTSFLRPSAPVEASTHLPTQEKVIARAGSSPSVAIGAGGTIAWYREDDAEPLWLAPLLEAPLPGIEGFLTPWFWPGVAARSPGKTGPSSDASYPWLWPATMTDGQPRFVITTDRAWIVTEAGIEESVGSLPEGILDATVDGDGNVILLSRDGESLLIRGKRIALERSGVYDIEAVDTGVLLLGRDLDGDHLSRLDGETATLLPLPHLHQEEDRAQLRVAALGRWGNSALLLTREVWILDEGQWRLIVPWKQPGRRQETHWCQSPPRTVGDRIWIARPWGAIEVWRNP